VAELWFALLSLTLVLFVVLDGWNIGAGVLHLVVAKTDPERREVIAALGPLWSWNEVWLVAAGGTFLLAFPRIMAVSFAGFYLALWLVLWSFVLRGISIEVGGHIPDTLWQSAWDFVFTLSSVLLAVLFGAALGNVLRGVPLDGTGQFSMSLFTDFGVRGRVGILDWYTVSVAVFTTVLIAAHGGTYLELKTTGRVHERSAAWARRLWIATAFLFVVITIQTHVVRPDLYGALIRRPSGWLAMAAMAAGAFGIWTGSRGRVEQRAFAGSCAVIAGLLFGAAASVFPVMLHSTLAPEHSLTIYDGATAERGLTIALIWWPLAFILAFTYFVGAMRNYRHRDGRISGFTERSPAPDGSGKRKG
jgi:cytochrome bd ubiquinol oxidase subunit II